MIYKLILWRNLAVYTCNYNYPSVSSNSESSVARSTPIPPPTMLWDALARLVISLAIKLSKLSDAVFTPIIRLSGLFLLWF